MAQCALPLAVEAIRCIPYRDVYVKVLISFPQAINPVVIVVPHSLWRSAIATEDLRLPSRPQSTATTHSDSFEFIGAI